MSGASSLNSGVPATPNRSKSTVSVLVTVAPAFSHSRKPTWRFSSVRETIASCGMKTEKPPRSRSRTVWKTHTCASIPATMTCLRPVCRISRATGSEAPQENSSFSIGSLGKSSRSSGTVSPRPFLYCSLATTGRPRRPAALSSTAAFLFSRAIPSAGMARASLSCTSTRRTSASPRSRASDRGSIASDGIALGSARRGRFRIEHHVDASDGGRGDGALERGPDLRRILDVLSVPTERLDHLVVARRRKQRRGALLRTEELHLGQADLSPGGVISHHAHHRQLEAQRRLEVHAVQSERAVALDDEDGTAGVQKLRGDRERRTHSQAPERPRIEPSSRAAELDPLRRDRDPVSAVRDEHAVARRASHVVQLPGEPEVVDRLLIAVLQLPLPLGFRRLALPERGEPIAALATGSERRLDLREDAARIAHDAHVDRAVAADLGCIGIDLHDLRRLAETGAVAEAEIERRADHDDDVRLGESVLARVREEMRMLGRQRPSAGAVQVQWRARALGQRGELRRGVVPVDGAARDDGGTLGPLEQARRLLDQLGIPRLARARPVRGRERTLRVFDAIREHVPRHFEDSPPRAAGCPHADG